MHHKVRYEIGAHLLEVTAERSRWTAAVDGVRLERWFLSSAEAWTAGVAEALRLDGGEAPRFVGPAAAPAP